MGERKPQKVLGFIHRFPLFLLLGVSSILGARLIYLRPAQLSMHVEGSTLFPTATRPAVQPPVLEPQRVSLDIVWEMLAQVDADRALQDLRRLSGDQQICLGANCYTIQNRLTGSVGLEWAQDYLYETLVALGYTVEVLDWARSGYTDQNIVARNVGLSRPDEEIYFIAHVDGAGSASTVYPAADDNASSVANSLELARILSGYEFERTFVLLLTSGEEQGIAGASEYLEQLSAEELEGIVYAVNRDMTGYDGNGDRVMELFHGDHPPSVTLTQTLSQIIDLYQLDLDARIVAGCP